MAQRLNAGVTTFHGIPGTPGLPGFHGGFPVYDESKVAVVDQASMYGGSVQVEVSTDQNGVQHTIYTNNTGQPILINPPGQIGQVVQGGGVLTLQYNYPSPPDPTFIDTIIAKMSMEGSTVKRVELVDEHGTRHVYEHDPVISGWTKTYSFLPGTVASPNPPDDWPTEQEVIERHVAKGDVLAVACLAATMGAKRTADLIPLCHPLAIEGIAVEAVLDPALPGVRLSAQVTLGGKTGVEMEALVAVAVGCLAVYDMVKAIDRGMEIGKIRLVEKRGGQRGDYRRPRSSGGKR